MYIVPLYALSYSIFAMIPPDKIIILHFIDEETKLQRSVFPPLTQLQQQCWDWNPGLSDFRVHGLSARHHWC